MVKFRCSLEMVKIREWFSVVKVRVRMGQVVFH